ncbi:MAG: Protein GrpE [Parcubacteria group bacterium GW2011_GWC2_45_7]|nr:MAG: Protein GrpE [Parcubacteria group bacterium GW2011_GWC2_45_7]
MSDESKQQAQQPEQQPAPETTAVKPEIGAKLEIDLEKQCAEYKLGWQRAVADYQNLQKEIASRRAELVSMSEQQILEEFIPVYDNFKKAFSLKPASEGKQTQSWINGIGFIITKWKRSKLLALCLTQNCMRQLARKIRQLAEIIRMGPF